METQCRYRTHRHCYSDTSVLCLSKKSTLEICKRSISDSGELEICSNDLYFDTKVQTVKQGQMTKQTEKKARFCRLFQVNSCPEVLTNFRRKLMPVLVFLYFCLILGRNYYNGNFERERDYFGQNKIGKNYMLADILRFRSFSLSVEIVMPSSMDKYFNNMANGQSQRANNSMSVEMLRIYSLRDFPRNINISMIRLARAGFYSTGNSTETRCFRCGVIYRDWISGDDPMHIHRQLSPTCDLVSNGDGRDNIGEELQNTRKQERREGQSSNSNGISTGHVSLPSNENIGSLNNVTSRQHHHGVSHNNPSARNVDHHDTVRNEPTEISIPRIQSHESNTYTHSNKTFNSNCNINSQNMSTNNNCPASDYERNCTNNQADTDIQNLSPRYVNYSPLQIRISSFEGWPGYLNQTPRAMALAGFLFAGYHDYTRCFHCGGGLRNWEAGDDPWVEHARWFPQCGFLKQNKGENFIQAVLKKHSMDQRAKGNSTFSTKVDRTVTTYKNATMASASASGLDQSSMCTPSIHVQKEAKFINTSPGIQTVTHNDRITTASRVNNNFKSDSTTNIEHTERILQTIAARTVLEMGFTSHQVVDAVREIQRLNSGEGGTNVSATDIMNFLLREDHLQTTDILNLPETSTAEGSVGASFDDTDLILEENRQLQEQRQCKVCREFDSTVAFLPCGHIVCCTDCAPAMRKCPVCKTYVKGTVKTFLA
ncbi:baculoviral IAP repeat-containing protein 3-like [Mytilus galloprovincialis]|uniref:baculoviral IAP repeat-containing protein 3-like n=1 Tax=Mytilus galloprovincialis TaxID=29158 RepID=UPI003F7BEB53